MDALSEVLRLVRLTGAVFLNAELSAPWAVQSPPSTVLAQAMMPEADHMIEYHLVVEGQCFIEVTDKTPVEAPRAGRSGDGSARRCAPDEQRAATDGSGVGGIRK